MSLPLRAQLETPQRAQERAEWLWGPVGRHTQAPGNHSQPQESNLTKLSARFPCTSLATAMAPELADGVCAMGVNPNSQNISDIQEILHSFERLSWGTDHFQERDAESLHFPFPTLSTPTQRSLLQCAGPTGNGLGPACTGLGNKCWGFIHSSIPRCP